MHDIYTVPTEPAIYPVSLVRAKEYLKVDYDADDNLITSLIESATDILEGYTQRWFIQRTEVVGDFDSIQVTNQETYPFVEIRRSPLISVASVQNFLGGAFQNMTVDTDYQVKRLSSFSRIVFFNAINVDDDIVYPLRVTFNAGYGAEADVPSTIKTAIMQLVNHMWLNRGDCVEESAGGSSVVQGITVPKMILALVNKYKILNTFG